jgi:ABC-type glycerol-3-phosphate transport system substrate-binding protein
MNDAVYARNARIEERYGVNIISIPVNGTWDEQTTFTSTLQNAVSAGSQDFHLVAGYLAYASSLAMNDCFYNLHEVNNVDFTNEWWSQSFIDNCTIYDCLYFADGDISLTMWESLYALFFNKEIADDRGIDNLYELAADGEWTMEELYTMTEDLYEDNGNDAVDAEDLFGMVINSHSLRAMVTTCGIPITARNEDDGYDLVFFSEKTVNLFDELFAYVHDNDSVYMAAPSDDSDYTEILNMFTAGRSLFISGTLDQSARLRNMETNFGILPFPKYDEEQETYLSHSYDGHSIFAIPSSLVDTDMSGMIMEALGAESRYSVIPKYYDVVLKGRTTRDDESQEMLDIIRENLFFDFGFVHSVYLDRIYSHFGDLIKTGSNTFVSSHVSSEQQYISKLEEIMETYWGLAE